jgi:radical SAM protein with 4Fe4S-binding SPASM domain
MTKYNIAQAADLVRLLRSLGVEEIALTSVGRSLFVADFDSLFFDPGEYMWFETAKQVAASYKTPPLRISANRMVAMDTLAPEERIEGFKNRSQCTAGRWGFVVLSDGKVITCDEMPIVDPFVVGDVSKQSISEVWASPQIGYLLQPPQEKFAGTACHDCPDFVSCHAIRGRCFRDALKAYGSFYAPTPGCPRAPRGRRVY